MATGISSLTLLTGSPPAPRFAGPIPNPAKLLLYQRHQQDRKKLKIALSKHQQPTCPKQNQEGHVSKSARPAAASRDTGPTPTPALKPAFVPRVTQS